MRRISLPEKENIYETRCPILYAMDVFGRSGSCRSSGISRKERCFATTMLTKSLRELETDRLVRRKQYDTIPPTVEYSLTERGKSLIPALESLYQWAEKEME